MNYLSTEFPAHTCWTIQLFFFVTEVSFHSVFKEIWLFPKIMVLPSGTSSQTPDLENFAMASRLRCQQNSSSSTVEFVDDTRMTSSGCLLQVD